VFPQPTGGDDELPGRLKSGFVAVGEQPRDVVLDTAVVKQELVQNKPHIDVDEQTTIEKRVYLREAVRNGQKDLGESFTYPL